MRPKQEKIKLTDLLLSVSIPFSLQIIKASVSISSTFIDFHRLNYRVLQMPCEISCTLVLKDSLLSPPPPSASAPDFTGNVLRALLKAKAGTTVTLDCKPQAYPTASILWKKGNLPIHTNDR